MDEDSFVLAALEEKMKIFWPYPKSQYFCRCCNYSEFVSQALLDRHLQSARHLVILSFLTLKQPFFGKFFDFFSICSQLSNLWCIGAQANMKVTKEFINNHNCLQVVTIEVFTFCNDHSKA